MPPKCKLIYFPVTGRAEMTRLMFAAAGVKYEDERIKWEDWPKLKTGAMTHKYKMIYFPRKGRAEMTRLVFAATGVKFEDERITLEDWPKLKPEVPQGLLPILEIDGKVILAQSLTIARYIARELKFYGKNNLEAARIDQILDTLQDLMTASIPYLAESKQDKAKKDEARKKFCEGDALKYLGFLEKAIADGGKDDYAVSSSVHSLHPRLPNKHTEEVKPNEKRPVNLVLKPYYEDYQSLLFYEELDKVKFSLSDQSAQGQLPILEIDGKVTLAQSLTIARYIARELNFYGKNNLEAAYIDQILDTLQDLVTAAIPYLVTSKQDKDKKDEARKKFREGDALKYFGFVEKAIGDGGEDGYAVSNSLSVADFSIFAFLEFFGLEFLLDKFPKVAASCKKVESDKNVAKWLKERPANVFHHIVGP